MAVQETLTEERLPRPNYSYAKRHGVLVEYSAEQAVVICRPGVKRKVLQEVQRLVGQHFQLEDVDEHQFARRLAAQYEQGTDGAKAMMEDLGDELDLDSIANTMPEPEDLLEAEDDAPIIRLINALLTQGVKENASDIHIEPFENRLLVRMRVDGVLQEVLEPPRKLGALLVSRIKVMSKMDIAEKRLPQDGRISLRVAGRSVDVRVSTLPSGHGERVVLRLLDKAAGRLDLSHLGMPDHTRGQLNKVIHQPHGIILVTGPTGSGKTTTLYAALAELKSSSRNILTVEDPVEYFIDGIGQTQVNNKVDMSFARGLRAILRQDPDVVMVGEIRDLETAEIAVQASLTGHLVLSTLHTNTAIGAVTRLRDMGVEPFLLSTTLIGALAQRLVRRLCPSCKSPYTASEAECRILGINAADKPTIYAPNGCAECRGTGYRGRTGLYELVTVTDGLRQLISNGADEIALNTEARKTSENIRGDGRYRVLRGDTSLEEVVRVTQEETE